MRYLITNNLLLKELSEKDEQISLQKEQIEAMEAKLSKYENEVF